jgi:hypothetical protein
MRTLLLTFVLVAPILSGCAMCDQRPDDDLPPKPGFFERVGDDINDPNRPFHWFGPNRNPPGINPPIPELPPTREPTAPRAEDPSWRNR